MPINRYVFWLGLQITSDTEHNRRPIARRCASGIRNRERDQINLSLDVRLPLAEDTV
jgi:hypothetical protein